jgi:DNA-binding response OmpR family regulator
LEDANQMPVCVIVDLDLPDGDATELLKQLDGVPVLALSRSRNLERQAEAIGLGADEVVNTKGAVEEIVAAVERLIGQARAPSSSGEAKKYTGRLPWSRP